MSVIDSAHVQITRGARRAGVLVRAHAHNAGAIIVEQLYLAAAFNSCFYSGHVADLEPGVSCGILF